MCAVMCDNSKLFSSGVCFRVVADIGLLCLVAAPILLLNYIGQPYERGFYCDDESLRYPYLDSTVPAWLLYFVGVVLPMVFIIITETTIVRWRPSGRRWDNNWGWNCYKHIVVFLLGVGLTQLTTDIGKYTIGRLRPHFFQVCSPSVDCTDPKLKNLYIENFHCLGTDEYLLKDMRMSFPSGHSSISAYGMVFMAMYCGAKLTWPRSRRIRCIVQYMCLIFAFYTGLTRISDYKHHWSDVLIGFAVGTVTAISVVRFASDLFEEGRVSCNRKGATPTTESTSFA